MSGRAWFGALLGIVVATNAQAYDVKAGDLLVRPVVGASLNVVRFDAATRATPPAGMLLGVDLDYSFDGPLNFTGALRPVFSPRFIDINVGGGVKYRATQLEAPFIPFASAMVTLAAGVPVGAGAFHSNVGGRAALGVDYFVMRHLAISAEVAAEASALLTPTVAPEMSTELLLGVSYKI